MGRKDEEIKRIVQYANGLGIRVEWKPHKRGDPGASWNMDGGIIEVFTWPRKSKIRSILDLVHELAHHMAWVHSGRIKDVDLEQAWINENECAPITKEQRKLIYLSETHDAQYRNRIVKELGLNVPEWRQKLDRALDIWWYRQYYLIGKYPSLKEMDVKQKELRAKFTKERDDVNGLK